MLPCQAHVASLLLKDIGAISEVAEVIKEEGILVGWFTNHQKPLAILREKTAQLFGKGKELVKAAATRFGTNSLVGKRLLELKSALQATVVDTEYVKQNYKDAADDVEMGNGENTVRQHKGSTAKKHVLDDDGFWGRVSSHVRLSMPIFKLLRRHDSSAPTIGKVYSGWYQLGEDLEKAPELANVSYKDRAKEKFDIRWAYGHSPFAAAAYVVDPEFRHHEQSSNEEVMHGFMDTVEKIGILLEVRRLQALDSR